MILILQVFVHLKKCNKISELWVLGMFYVFMKVCTCVFLSMLKCIENQLHLCNWFFSRGEGVIKIHKT